MNVKPFRFEPFMAKLERQIRGIKYFRVSITTRFSKFLEEQALVKQP